MTKWKYKISELLKVIDSFPKDDTEFSEKIFEVEEARYIPLENRRSKDWLDDADEKNGGKYNQRFHLKDHLCYLQKKNKEYFYLGNLNNVALILYCREIFGNSNENLKNTSVGSIEIKGESKSDLLSAYNDVKSYYKQPSNSVNSAEVGKIARGNS